VIARQSVWTNPEVKKLAAKFIPAADNVMRLQRGDDAECRLFQKIAEQGHYGNPNDRETTRQGTYATTADGTFLASWNDNDPRNVARKLREALQNWNRLKAKGRTSSGEDQLDISQLNRADRFFPEGGLVLKVNTRDLPRVPRQQGVWARAWNQDFAWFTNDEARQFLPGEIAPGQRCKVPRPLVERLARLHFLDNVRGQASPFPAGAIEDATLTSEVAAVDGDLVSLRLEGQTKAVLKGKWPIEAHRDMYRPSVQERGLDLELLGMARFDRKQGRFVGFEVVAVGTRWGGTQFNFRHNDLAPAPFGAVLSLAGKSRVERVAPEHFEDYGWRSHGAHEIEMGVTDSNTAAELEDDTPENALKTFLIALAARDLPTLRSVTQPHPQLQVLLTGPNTTPDELDQLKVRLAHAPIKRLKEGDPVKMPNGETRTIQKEDVRAGRVVLLPTGETLPFRIERVGGSHGHWKVFAAPLIAARKNSASRN
jgi:hypothetical protein